MVHSSLVLNNVWLYFPSGLTPSLDQQQLSIINDQNEHSDDRAPFPPIVVNFFEFYVTKNDVPGRGDEPAP